MRQSILLLLAVATNALAAEQFLPPVTTGCNDLNDPGRSPGKQFEMFFDIQRPTGDDSGARSEQYPEVGSPILPDIGAQSWDTALPEQPPNLLDPVRLDRKKLSIHGGYIYYYEPDGKGGRRLCRLEEWANRTVVASKLDTEKSDEYKTVPRTKYNRATVNRDPYVAGPPPQPGQTHNPILAEIAKTYVPIAATRFRYDTAGHLVERASFSDDNAMAAVHLEEEKVTRPDWRLNRWPGYSNDPQSCRLYHPDGKLWRYVHGLAQGVTDCFNARAETADYFEYRYDANGKLVRSIQNLAAPNKEHKWFQIWRMVVNGYQVEAEADDKDGVRYIAGSIDLVAPKDNNPLNAKGGVYFFPNHDAPISLLDDFSKIYNYYRVRERGTGIARMVEAFPAGSSQLAARVWLNTYNNTLLRQEQYKDGKLVRAINTDRAYDPTQDYYEEHLEKYAIKPKNLVQRVYEYDAQGKEKLVAISWTNVSKEEFYGDAPSPGKIGPLVDLAKDVKKAWKNRGKPAQPKPERLEFYYGLPDGTVKWKNFEAFQKTFDIQDNADWLYPNGQPKRF